MEVGLVLLVLFLFMFIQGIFLAIIMIKLSDLTNNQVTWEDLEQLTKQIETLRIDLIELPKPRPRPTGKNKAGKKPAPEKNQPSGKKIPSKPPKKKSK